MLLLVLAKSEYYLRDETGWLAQTSKLEQKLGSVYLPWERWLMSRKSCKAVFPRDSLTAETLQKLSVPAYDLGNPMMDAIAASPTSAIATESQKTSAKLRILLLAGSRMPEALDNWQQILACLSSFNSVLPSDKLEFLGAIAPTFNLRVFIEDATEAGWQVIAEKPQIAILAQGDSTLVLNQRSYVQFLQQADVAIAMAGTATEQFVGLGKPAIIMPGQGPQFTYAFAEAQSRLLGCSIHHGRQPRTGRQSDR